MPFLYSNLNPHLLVQMGVGLLVTVPYVTNVASHFLSAPLTYKTLSNEQHVCYMYKGADKSLARPGRKQATATEDSEFHISYL